MVRDSHVARRKRRQTHAHGNRSATRRPTSGSCRVRSKSEQFVRPKNEHVQVEYTSKQILDTNHGTRFPEEGTPKGRAWANTSELGFRVVQVPYLPNATEDAPWPASVAPRPPHPITGSKDRLRALLAAQGYQQVMVPNSDGGREPR